MANYSLKCRKSYCINSKPDECDIYPGGVAIYRGACAANSSILPKVGVVRVDDSTNPDMGAINVATHELGHL